jgi:hypothetical protein
MDTNKITREEYNFAEEAYDEYLRDGKTNKKCPRCGSDFVFITVESGYTLKCKTENCFSVTVRGI